MCRLVLSQTYTAGIPTLTPSSIPLQIADDASEIRREQRDMISPLMATPIMSSVRRMGTKKAWKVLGVSEQDPVPSPKGQRGVLGRSRSKSQGVVGMAEYEKKD